MNWDAISFDWNHVRAFLATVENGSLSAAARALGQTQPTLSRQISLLEEALQLTLFERGTRSMRLTDAGAELLSHVRGMADAATRISRVAAGQSQAIEGTVRITSSDAMAAYALPPCLVSLREKHPGISVELFPSNEMSDLTRREADIAIRHARPEQPDLVAKRIADIEVSLFASIDYLGTLGTISSLADFSDASFIGFGHPERLVSQVTAMGIPVTRQNFGITTSHGVTMFELAREGAGIALLPTIVAERRLGLRRIHPEVPVLNVETWLVTHREIQTNRRIRLTFDHLAKEIAQGTLNDSSLAGIVEKAFTKGKPAAVALSKNSPGGSPAQSSLISARIRRLVEEKGVKVCAFVEDVAATGGNYIASAADEIWVGSATVATGLVDGVGHLVQKMKEVFGEKVAFKRYEQRHPFLNRFGV